jgi:hypothetical protein
MAALPQVAFEENAILPRHARKCNRLVAAKACCCPFSTLITWNSHCRCRTVQYHQQDKLEAKTMTYKGTVQNGVILIDGDVRLPEGAEVQIELADDAHPTADTSGEPTIGQKLAALGRWAETQPSDLPEDLAINHDHYLHGLPKKS